MSKVVDARIHIGGDVWRTEKIELCSTEEAKILLTGENWEYGGDLYDVKDRTKRIGWIADVIDNKGNIVESYFIEANT